MNTEEEKKDDLKDAGTDTAGNDKPESQTISPEEISNLESAAVPKNDAASASEIARIPNQKKGSFLNKGSKFKKRAGLISLATTLLGAFGLLFTFFLGPLKLSVFLDVIESKHFAATKYATDSYSEHLVSQYIKKTVLPNLNDSSCPSSRIVRNCSANIDGENGPVKRLYQGWKNNNFEGMLADRGLEIRKNGANYTVTIDNNPSNQIKFTDQDIDTIDITGGRKEARKAIREVLDKDLHSDSALKRFRMGGFIQKKYGVKRCLFACDLRDDYADWKDKKHSAFKMKLIERVVEPRSQYAGILFSCMVEGCNPSPDPNDPDRRDAFSKKLESKMTEYVRLHGAKGQTRIDNALKFLDEFNNGKTLSKIIVEKGFSKALGEKAGSAVGKYMNPIGWINTAISVIVAVNNISSLGKWVFALNSAAVVSFYMNYRTMVDEVNSGVIEPETLGDFVNALSSTEGASAEQSPLYSDYFVNNSTTGKIASFFSPHVYAEGEADLDPNTYICNNGQPVDRIDGGNGKICPEDSLMTNSKLVETAGKIKNIPGFGPLTTVANGYNQTVSKFTGFLLDSAQKIPGIGPAIDGSLGLLSNATSTVTQPIMGVITDSIAPPIIPDDIDQMSGAKNFTLLAAGANVAGNEFSHYGLGGKKLSDEEAFAIHKAVQKEENERFASLSIKDRLFSTVENKSLISQLAMTVPFDSHSPSRMASILARVPLKTFSSTTKLISNIGVQKVKAAEPYKDPFGVTQYGYPLNYDFNSIDPSKLTDEYCAKKDKEWLDAASSSSSKDPNNGTDLHTSVNECRLNEAVVTSLGAVFGVIEKNSSPSSLTGGDTNNGPSQSIPSLNIVYGDTSNLTCPAGEDAGIGDGYSDYKLYKIRLCSLNGNLDNLINAQIVSNVDLMLKKARSENINLDYYSAFRTMEDQIKARVDNGCPDVFNSESDECEPDTAKPGTSNHQMGLAFDMSCNGITITKGDECFAWLSKNAELFGLKNLPKEPWHWSVDGR